MRIYEAILQAAADIESAPHLYKFTEVAVPGPQEVGCVLGHIGRVAGVRRGSDVRSVVPLLDIPYCMGDAPFYSAMEAMRQPHDSLYEQDWRYDPAVAVKRMRRLAEHYKPADRSFSDIMAELQRQFLMQQPEHVQCSVFFSFAALCPPGEF